MYLLLLFPNKDALVFLPLVHQYGGVATVAMNGSIRLPFIINYSHTFNLFS